MADKPAIISIERDFAKDRLIVTRADGSKENVFPEQILGKVTWDAESGHATVSHALKDLVIDNG